VRPNLKLLPRDVPPDNTTSILYCRVSTDDQAGEDKESLPTQEGRTRADAEQRGYATHYTWCDDRSGRDESRLEEIVSWCEAHPGSQAHPKSITVTFDTRWARLKEPRKLPGYELRLEAAGWWLHVLARKRTGDKAMDFAFGALSQGMATKESDEKEDRARVGIGTRVKAGRAPCKVALGYRKVPAGHDKARILYKLDRDPATAPTVVKVFALAAAGKTLAAIETATGVKESTIRQMLSNPVFLGHTVAARAGRRYEAKGANLLVHENTHPALIHRKTWDTVQARLSRNGSRPARRTDGLPYILSGLVRCATCQKPLYGGGGVPKDATPAFRLRHAGYVCKVCGARVNQVEFEGTVATTIAKYLRELDEEGGLGALSKLSVIEKLKGGSTTAIEQQRADLLKRKARLLTLAEETDDPDLAGRLKEITAKLAALDAKRTAKPDPAAVKAEAERSLAGVRAFIAGVTAKQLTPQTVNACLASVLPLIPTATYNPETRLVEVNFRNPFAVLTEAAVVPGKSHSKRSVACPGT
jgi:DNA invertase Pin-like site-specific DNA recombinase